MGRDKIKEIAEQIKQGTYTNANSRKIDKALVIEYKNYLADAYAIISANSMIASVNAFLRFMGRLLFRVKIKLERYLLCANFKKSC